MNLSDLPEILFALGLVVGATFICTVFTVGLLGHISGKIIRNQETIMAGQAELDDAITALNTTWAAELAQIRAALEKPDPDLTPQIDRLKALETAIKETIPDAEPVV